MLTALANSILKRPDIYYKVWYQPYSNLCDNYNNSSDYERNNTALFDILGLIGGLLYYNTINNKEALQIITYIDDKKNDCLLPNFLVCLIHLMFLTEESNDINNREYRLSLLKKTDISLYKKIQFFDDETLFTYFRKQKNIFKTKELKPLIDAYSDICFKEISYYNELKDLLLNDSSNTLYCAIIDPITISFYYKSLIYNCEIRLRTMQKELPNIKLLHKKEDDLLQKRKNYYSLIEQYIKKELDVFQFAKKVIENG